MKKIIVTLVLVMSSSIIFAQTYNMKIKQGVGTTYSATSTVDEITFENTTSTPFVCGGVILYGGETYHTILIGSQCWFQENLNIGTRINGSTNQTNTAGTIEKYCYADVESNCTTYGGLYQWAEAVQYLNGATNSNSPSPAFSGNVQGICPSGWHIPTQVEFQTLSSAVSNDGNALKAVGQGTGSGAGTNTSGFSALLAGHGIFIFLGSYTFFWSSTEGDASYDGGYVALKYLDSGIYMSSDVKIYGFSIRCLKDN